MMFHPLVKTAYTNVVSFCQVALPLPRQKSLEKSAKGVQGWHYMLLLCVAFWAIFAVVLTMSGFPFLLVPLTILALLSFMVVVLAWAYQNNL